MGTSAHLYGHRRPPFVGYVGASAHLFRRYFLEGSFVHFADKFLVQAVLAGASSAAALNSADDNFLRPQPLYGSSHVSYVNAGACHKILITWPRPAPSLFV